MKPVSLPESRRRTRTVIGVDMHKYACLPSRRSVNRPGSESNPCQRRTLDALWCSSGRSGSAGFLLGCDVQRSGARRLLGKPAMREPPDGGVLPDVAIAPCWSDAVAGIDTEMGATRTQVRASAFPSIALACSGRLHVRGHFRSKQPEPDGGERQEVAESVSWRSRRKAAIGPTARPAAWSICRQAHDPEKEHRRGPST